MTPTPIGRDYAHDQVARQLLERTIVETVLAPEDEPRTVPEILYALQVLDRACFVHLPGLTIDHVAGALNELEHRHRIIVGTAVPGVPVVRLPDTVAT